ncbi:hypothetical protein B0H13DRAFT_1921936 [Mycena leptocephala]|nr:hypothetical protein B0H13DRAFT_1921936 [Mycena leptocephala]
MTTTLQFPGASLSILGSDLPNNSTTHFVAAVLLVAVVVFIGHYASPRRLTRVLVTAIASVEKSYLEALKTGLLSPSDVHTAEMVSTLQFNVSAIREVTLRSSQSLRSTLREFLNGHIFTLLRCIREVRVLEIHIEILKEAQLREDGLNPFADCARVEIVSLRRRCHSPDLT